MKIRYFEKSIILKIHEDFLAKASNRIFNNPRLKPWVIENTLTGFSLKIFIAF